jgi:bromodomain adjacent to zinc finger domain protein 1A
LKEIISGLSKALLQIEQSVERRFLRLPLGDVPKTPDKMKNKTKKTKQNDEDSNDVQSNGDSTKWQTILNWERSLMNCTNLSQLFIHFQSLDESIAWSKSCLNTRCRLCRKKGDADKMLLCDKCDRGHHIYCLRPVLKVKLAFNLFNKYFKKILII